MAPQLVGASGRQGAGKGLELGRRQPVNPRRPARQLEHVARGRGEVELAPVEDLVGPAGQEAREAEAPEHRRGADFDSGEREALALLGDKHVADANEPLAVEREHLRVEDVTTEIQEVAGMRRSLDHDELVGRHPHQGAGQRGRPSPPHPGGDDGGML